MFINKYFDQTMKKLITLISFALILKMALGQNDPQVTLNMYNHMSINPGYAGSNEMICAKAINKLQWTGFGDGTPKTTILNVNAPVNLLGISSGVGINIVTDNIGFNSTNNLGLTYAYRMEVGDGMLGAGINLGIISSTIKPDWETSEFLENGTQNDQTIPLEGSKVAFDAAFGLYYRADDFYAGLSTTHLNEATIEYDEGKNPFIKRHYYLTGGYHWQTPNPLFAIQPSVMIKSDGVATQIDVAAMVVYNKMFTGGVVYRTGESIPIVLSVTLTNGLQIGYAYDLITSKDLSAAGVTGSHEFMVGYCFNVSKKGGKGRHRSVRFLN